MKKLFVVATLSACTLPAFAQKGVYIRMSGGIGMTNTAYKSKVPNPPEMHATLTHRLHIGVGYSFRKWSIETGLEFFRTGFKWKDQSIPLHGSHSPLVEVDVEYIFPHIGIPLVVGYKVPISKSLAFEPSLGAEAAYGLGRTVIMSGGVNDRQTITGHAFDYLHEKISIFGMAQLHLRYALTPKIGLYGGFSGKYMFSNQLVEHHGPIPDPTQHGYLATFDFGIRSQF